MASRKQQRKQAKRVYEAKHPRTGPFRHADGDRRRRGGIRVEDAIAQKRLMQQLGAVLPPESDEEE